jgi:beta-lactamase superfamily II metal-dependent hydrolase
MQLKVSFLYCVSHGDCAVVTFEEDGDTKCMVVDGGETKRSAQALREYLESEGVQTIDLLVATHIDADHIQGLNKFLEEESRREAAGEPHISIGRFWGPAPSQDQTPAGTSVALSEDATEWQRYVVQSVGQNDDLFTRISEGGVPISHPALDDLPQNPFQSVAIQLLGPDTQIPADEIKRKALGLTTRATSGEIDITDLEHLTLAISRNFELMAMEADRTANNQSIVFRLTPAAAPPPGSTAWEFLFPGDAEKEAWSAMLSDAAVASGLPARVIKLPHHGSRNGITDAGAQQVSPEFAVVSVGRKHGLPDAAGLRRAHSLGANILCTRRNTSQTEKSDCYSIPAQECPAKGDPQTITFTLDTDTGQCVLTPPGRACQHSW